MRHRISGGQLNRTTTHRVALRRNMAQSLFEHETISTTAQKARHVRGFVEKLITLAKKGDLAARRRAISLLGDRAIYEEIEGKLEQKGTVVGKLFSEIGPRYLERPGGYTRIIKLSKRRLGDNGELVLLQLVGNESKGAEKKSSGSKSKSKKKKTTVEEPEPIESKEQAAEQPPQQAQADQANEQAETEDNK